MGCTFLCVALRLVFRIQRLFSHGCIAPALRWKQVQHAVLNFYKWVLLVRPIGMQHWTMWSHALHAKVPYVYMPQLWQA